MQMIGHYLRTNPLAGLALLAGVMLATRFSHFGSATLLPDASLAVFFLLGFYFRPAAYMIPLLLLAGGIDYAATQHMGVSEYCLSPAYPFLIPTYAAMWMGGRWYAARHAMTVSSLSPLLIALLVSTSVAFVISNYSFYLFSDRYTDWSWAEYNALAASYFMPYIGSTIFYMALAAGAHIGVTRMAAMRGEATT